MHKRQFLKIISGSALLVGGATYIWAAPTAKSARSPWRDAGQYDDPIRYALSYAILAPNPHNRQPWIVDILSDTEAVLYCDPERHLPITDPFDRQITIGLGCFLETLDLAAKQKGYKAEFDLFPDGAHSQTLDGRAVAHIKLTSTTISNTGLFANVVHRRTDRTPFKSTPVANNDLDAVQTSAGTLCSYTLEEDKIDTLRTLCVDAARIEFMTPRTHGESVDLMRIGRKSIEENPDGIFIEGPMIELLNLGGVLSIDAMRDHNSPGFKQGLNMYLKAAQTAQGFIWITTPDNTRESQIAAGRTYMRANLKATELGISMHPLSQALQEYPEMEALLSKAHKTLNASAPNRIQMLARIGYGTGTIKAPRWPLISRLK